MVKLNNNRLKLVLGIVAAVVLLLGAVLLLAWSEGMASSGEDLWEVLENVIITLMGEYPDKPRTILGRIVQLFLLVFGTFLFGTIIGKISSLFVTHALWKQKQMKRFKNHIILCNWNGKAASIIQQLLESNHGEPLDIVVVSASEVVDARNFHHFENVHFIQSDPTHHLTLQDLQAFQAKAIILLADEESSGPDEKNALIALAVKHLEQTPGREKDIHVIAELVNLDRRRHLQEAGVDEVVSARDYSSGIIAQSAIFRNMSVVYQQLLTYSDDSNEFYFIQPGNYPSELLGKRFPELGSWISDYSSKHPNNPLLLLGVKRGNGQILLNPKPSHFDHLEEEDSLIVMAFRNIERIV